MSTIKQDWLYEALILHCIPSWMPVFKDVLMLADGKDLCLVIKTQTCFSSLKALEF